MHVLVLNAAGEIFLQKRSSRKDSWPGAWDSSASGHLDCGEDYDACAIRELREELGVVPRGPVERVWRIETCPETGQEFVWVYRTRHDGPFVLHPDEIETGQWFTVAAIDAAVTERPGEFALSFRHLWRALRTGGIISG